MFLVLQLSDADAVKIITSSFFPKKPIMSLCQNTFLITCQNTLIERKHYKIPRTIGDRAAICTLGLLAADLQSYALRTTGITYKHEIG
jgi:hypothetical protein